MSEQRNSYEDVEKLERELGMPDGWFHSLLRKEESDWSFVIKLHALFEAAVAHVINAKLNRPELDAFVERLNMHGPISKTALAKALNLLEPRHARIIGALSSIRNDCVHDVRNLTFQFSEYVKGLEQGRREGFLAAFVDLIRDEIPLGDDMRMPRDDFVCRHTRHAFWVAATVVLADLYTSKELAQRLASGTLTLKELLGTPGMLSGKAPS